VRHRTENLPDPFSLSFSLSPFSLSPFSLSNVFYRATPDPFDFPPLISPLIPPEGCRMPGMKRFRRWAFNGLAAMAVGLLLLFFSLWVQSGAVPGGYSMLLTHGTSWRVISRDGEIWIDFSADYARDGWLAVRGWHFGDAFFGDPIVIPGNFWQRLGFAHYAHHGRTWMGTRWIFPDWPLLVIGAVLAVPMARRISQRVARCKSGFCPKCGYDLRATPERCPECGTIPAKKPK